MHLENCVLKKCTYLPGRGDAMIRKVVFPGWGLCIALWMCWPLQFPQMWDTRPLSLSWWGTAFAFSSKKKKKKVSPHRMKEWRDDSKDGTLIPLSVLKLSVQLRTWKIQAMLQLYFPAWNCAIDITKKVFPIVRVLYSVSFTLHTKMIWFQCSPISIWKKLC